MALFGSKRDVLFMRHINRELHYKIVDTEVLYYKLILEDIKLNIYDESLDKIYYQPFRVPIFVDRSPNQLNVNEFGLDVQVTIRFHIFKDTAKILSMTPKQGDVISWDNKFYSIENIIENKYFVGKNSESWIKGDSFGYSFTYECEGSLLRESQLNVTDLNYGTNMSDYTIDRT